MVKRKIRIRTLDDEFSWEHEVDIQTEEEKEAERQRLYPDFSKASYLRYPCHYCGNEFYLKNPHRVPNMNPLSDGFICIYPENYDNYYDNNRDGRKLGRLIPVCRSCVKEFGDKNEPICIKPWLAG
jgi:hypothetical protein